MLVVCGATIYAGVLHTGNLLSYVGLLLSTLLVVSIFVLHCNDSEIVSASNSMHTWLFCFGSAYLLWAFLAYEHKVLSPSKHFLELRNNSKFLQKTGITGVS